MTNIDRESTDVVVIGAGLAGLTAADQLKSLGYDVIVFEGRDRVGGRIHTATIAGIPVDCGATWVGPNHTAVLDLVDRLGCELISQHHAGKGILSIDGKRRVESFGAMSLFVSFDINRILNAMTKLVDELPITLPWQHPNAEKLDSMSVATWLASKHALRGTRKFMNMFCLVQWGAPIEEVSLFNALRYIKTLGGIEAMMTVEGGNEQDRILGSAHSLVRKLADRLGPQVIVGSPVQSIYTEGEHVTVKTETQVVTARYVIVTASPEHRSTIDFYPPLPEQHYGLARSWRLGALSKAFAAFERPFWRDQGLSGQGMTDDETVFLTFDVSPSAEGPGILMAFCDGRNFDAYHVEDRRRRVIDQLVHLYGDEARDPIDYVDFSWGNDSFAPGGPNPALSPKTWTTFGRYLREPVGPIHWAGSETADDTSGSMNGAILSGQRAVDEVVARLKVNWD